MPGPNQRVSLRLQHRGRVYAFSTYVEDVTAKAITVIRPWSEEGSIPASPGDPVQVEYLFKSVARMQFVTRVLGVQSDGIGVLHLAAPTQANMQKLQQRHFVRLQTQLPLSYRVLSMPGESNGLGTFTHSITRDVSASGAQILCSEPYPRGTALEVRFVLNGRPLRIRSEAVRQVDRSSRGGVWTGIRFCGLPEAEREWIVRFIFSEERKLRRRGLL